MGAGCATLLPNASKYFSLAEHYYFCTLRLNVTRNPPANEGRKTDRRRNGRRFEGDRSQHPDRAPPLGLQPATHGQRNRLLMADAWACGARDVQALVGVVLGAVQIPEGAEAAVDEIILCPTSSQR